MADFTGTTGDDTQDGTNAADLFDYSQGGDDTLKGLKGDDTFLMGAALTAADSIIGGRGNDTVVLDGDYNVTFAATTIFNVEAVRLTAGHDYTINTAEESAVVGHTLKIDGSLLGAGDVLAFHGFAETDASLIVTGGAANDVLVGGSFVDTLNGGSGDDIIDGSDGDDDLGGRAGNDTIYGGIGNDHIGGGDNDDFLYGGVGNDMIEDLKGNNTINGGLGVNTLICGSGNDVINATADDAVVAGGGADTINVAVNAVGNLPGTVDAGDGDDTITIEEAIALAALLGGSGHDTFIMSADVTITQFGSGNGIEQINFEGGSEIRGDDGAGVYDLSGITAIGQAKVNGARGSDTIMGTASTDILNGGSGADTVSGGDGDDKINGGDSNYADTLNGDSGNDEIQGFDNDFLSGGDGDDEFAVKARQGGGSVSGGDGNDTIAIKDSSKLNCSVDGGTGNDTLILNIAGSGTPIHFALLQTTFTLAATAIENLTVNASRAVSIDLPGTDDTFDLTGVSVSTPVGVTIAGNAGSDHITVSHLSVDGGDGNDVLTGTGASLYGGVGDDVIGGTNSFVYGGDGNDVITNSGTAVNGAGGNDSITVSTGTAHGNDGDDTIVAGSGDAFGDAGNDILSGSARMGGGAGIDQTTGNAGANAFIFVLVTDSTGLNRDFVESFDTTNDDFDLNVAVTGVDATVESGALSATTFNTDLMSAVDLAHMAAHHAVLFTPDAGDLHGKTFLIIDANNQAGYQANADYVIELQNAQNLNLLSTTNFI